MSTLCAIYARKSTSQADRDDADKSVQRQVTLAREFIASKGWQVDEQNIHVDDAISGAETLKLRAKQRLLDVIANGAPFDVIVTQAPDRLSRRDGDEAISELKSITRRGIRVLFYADNTEFQHGTFATNTLGFLRAEFAAEFRRSVAAKTREALKAKHQRGHLVGGAGSYGYRAVCSACGEAHKPRCLGAHTELRIDPAQAAVVQRIFKMYVEDGQGLTRIAKVLNREGVAAPRRAGWTNGGVREILVRRLYNGEMVWGASKKRDAEGVVRQTARPAAEWVVTAMPQLRLIDEATWAQVAEMFKAREQDRSAGHRRGDVESAFLLSGFAVCGTCGGGFSVHSRPHGSGAGRHRKHFYACNSN